MLPQGSLLVRCNKCINSLSKFAAAKPLNNELTDTLTFSAVHSSQFCSSDNSSRCEGSDSITFSWSYFITFLLSQVIAGAGGAPIFSLCIAYLDENVSPKHTSIFIAIYYVSGFVGPSIGFVIGGQLLSTYVDIDQVSSSEPRRMRVHESWQSRDLG